jgi:hypothetical protein
MVDVGKLVPVPAGRLLMLLLGRCDPHMPIMHGRLFPGSRPGAYPARSPIKAYPAIGIIDAGPVDIGIMDDRGVDPCHRRIIPEMTAIPFSPIITMPAISIPIIYPAIIPDMRTPVTGIPGIDPTDKPPISGCP